jgi:hypothetical protein
MGSLTRLFLTLLYGTGLRLMEGLRLRVKDVDFAENQITVRDGKGAKDRVTMLPVSLQDDLRRHLREVERLHKKDLGEGFGKVYLPYALARKYPSAASEWAWQYVFPAAGRSRDPRSGIERRHHLPEQSIQRSFRRAVQRAGLAKAEGNSEYLILGTRSNGAARPAAPRSPELAVWIDLPAVVAVVVRRDLRPVSGQDLEEEVPEVCRGTSQSVADHELPPFRAGSADRRLRGRPCPPSWP